MNLRWKSFERKLKRRVRAEVRASTALRREYKQVRRGRRWWNIRIGPNTYRLIFWFVGLNFFARGMMPVELVLAFIWLWATASALWRSAQLQSMLYFGGELNLFNHLPITDDEIFRFQWRKFLHSSIWPGIDLAVLYAVLASRMGAGWQSPLIGLLFGCLQSVFNIGIAVSLLGFGFRRRLLATGLLFYASAIGLVFVGGSLPGLVSWLSDLAYWIPPAGWIQYALGLSVSRGMWSDWMPCLIAGTVLACYPVALRRLRQGYVLRETDFAQAFRLTATGEAAALRLKEYGEQFAQAPQDAAATVKRLAFLDRLDWQKAGLVERIVALALTERERTIAEFLTASNPGWTKGLRALLIAGVVLLILAKFFSAQLASGIGVITFVVVFLLMGGSQSWRGFGSSAVIGLPPPFYAFYPMSFTELHRTVLKVMLVRFLVMVPFFAGAAYLFGGTLNLKTGLLLTYVLKFSLAGIVAQPLLAIMPFSASSNDSDRFRFAVIALIYGLLTVACGGAFIFVQSPTLAYSAGLAGTLLCWFAPKLYGWRFDRNGFDLLPSARSTTSTALARG